MDIHIEKNWAGEKCIFVHGAGGSSQSWYFQKKHLQESMEVILIDLPGHGKSHGNGCDTVEELRDTVYKAIQRSDIEKCYMAGHSMGGAITMSFALSHPDILKGMILIGTGAKLKVFPEILEGVLKNKEKTIKKIVEFAFSKKVPLILKENGFKEMMKCKKETIYRDFYACDHFDVMNTINNVQIPTLIICGKDDLFTPQKYSEYLHKEIKGSRLSLIEGAGHMAMLEKPDEVNKAIEKFIADCGLRNNTKNRERAKKWLH